MYGNFNKDRELRRNGEGYPDSTAYKAIKHDEQEMLESKNRHYKLMGLLLRACEVTDFQVEERIVLRDKRTGKVYR